MSDTATGGRWAYVRWLIEWTDADGQAQRSIVRAVDIASSRQVIRRCGGKVTAHRKLREGEEA